MDIQQLIDRGEKLKNESYESPIVDMWQNDVKALVATYGEETSKVLQKAMWFGQVIMSDHHGQQMHVEMITKVQSLLAELAQRNSDDTRAQSEVINQKRQEVRATLTSKFDKATFNINAPTTFGDNSPANNIQVSELMLAIISEAEEKLPEGPEKNKILSELKNVTANPTFAAIAGASLPEILKQLLK